MTPEDAGSYMDPSPRSATPPTAPWSAASHDLEPEVATFLADVRAAYRQDLPHDVAASHMRMILAEAAIAPTAPALGERWSRYARRVAAIGAVKIALTATAAAAATGTGLAATGSLPAPAQTAVAEAAGLVGITLPTPALDVPAARSDVGVTDRGVGEGGIGEGGVPALIDDGDTADLPGATDTAPGLHKEDGRPATPADDRPADPADERPEPATPDTPAKADDTPAADRPEPADSRPAPPADAADAGASSRPDVADDARPVERPEQGRAGGNG